jgi:hypothetical protein
VTLSVVAAAPSSTISLSWRPCQKDFRTGGKLLPGAFEDFRMCHGFFPL